MLNSMPEIGKPVPGYEGLYEVSNHGRISNYRKVLKTYKINSGYVAFKLQKNGARKSILLHRLVAELFVPNPGGKPEVNHIDGNKENNRADNLEWVTSSENKLHAYSSGIREYNEPMRGQKMPNSKSRFHNVCWDSARGRWVGKLTYNNRPYKQKRFTCELEAARYVNQLLDELGLHDRPRNQV